MIRRCARSAPVSFSVKCFLEATFAASVFSTRALDSCSSSLSPFRLVFPLLKTASVFVYGLDLHVYLFRDTEEALGRRLRTKNRCRSKLGIGAHIYAKRAKAMADSPVQPKSPTATGGEGQNSNAFASIAAVTREIDQVRCCQARIPKISVHREDGIVTSSLVYPTLRPFYPWCFSNEHHEGQTPADRIRSPLSSSSRAAAPSLGSSSGAEATDCLPEPIGRLLGEAIVAATASVHANSPSVSTSNGKGRR